MASDTVPAAVPGPGDPAGNTSASPQQQPRGLAGLLSAVDPARPDTFTLHPTGEQAGTGMSSADYHAGNTDNPTGKAGTNSSGKAPQGVVRAWLLAGAERWRKGADARIKRLDMQKAAHQANQVKETRTVSVNKSGGFLTNSGTRSTGSGGGKGASGKSLGSKSGSGSGGSGPKNTSGNSRSGSGTGSSGASKGRISSSTGSGTSGRSGAGGHSAKGQSGGGGARTHGHGSGSNAGGRGAHTSGKGGHTSHQTSGTRHGGDLKPRPTKTSGDKPAGKTPNSPASPAGTGKAGKNGKPGPQGPAAGTGKTTTQPAGKTNGSGKTTGADGTRHPRKAVDLEKTRKPSGKDAPKGQTPKKDTPGGSPTAKDSKTQPAPATGNTPKQDTAQPRGKRLNVLPSREAGYRDGARAGVVAAHISAWRDGARDGWTDTQQDAARQKKHLDQAHAAHQQRDKDKPVTSSADYHPTPDAGPQQAQPIQVTSIDATHIHLGAGADRTHVSRGEVRNLRKFQNRLDTKNASMTSIAEATKALHAHALDQAKDVTRLLEQAKAVKGGERLVAALAKLEDAARTQASKAEEIHKRAVRAAEACKTVHANTETRYGGIYQAVVNSPETVPAELAYYREMAHA